MFRNLALVAALFLGSQSALAGAPPGFSEGRNQGVSPVYKSKILKFDLQRGDCQKRPYGDGRGESDCTNGNSRSQVNTKKKQTLGRTYEYAFDFRVAPGFKYNGKGWGRVNYRSRLLIAEWQRVGTIKNHMYELHLDSARGVTFEDKVCVPPSRLSDWNSVRIRARWSNGNDGQLEVTCNGKVVYALRGPNAVPPGCGKPYKLQCKPELQDLSQPMQWQLGPMLAGHGFDWKRLGFPSVFPPFPKTGLQMEMRNIYYGRLRK